jgi:hypothetical protein
MNATLIVPGLNGSGPGHWQDFWLQERPEAHLVNQHDWMHPNLDDWLGTLEHELLAHPGAVVVGHSLGGTSRRASGAQPRCRSRRGRLARRAMRPRRCRKAPSRHRSLWSRACGASAVPVDHRCLLDRPLSHDRSGAPVRQQLGLRSHRAWRCRTHQHCKRTRPLGRRICSRSVPRWAPFQLAATPTLFSRDPRNRNLSPGSTAKRHALPTRRLSI